MLLLLLLLLAAAMSFLLLSDLELTDRRKHKCTRETWHSEEESTHKRSHTTEENSAAACFQRYLLKLTSDTHENHPSEPLPLLYPPIIYRLRISNKLLEDSFALFQYNSANSSRLIFD